MSSTAFSHEALRLLEGIGLTGSWSWSFETGEQIWSPGLYRLLGFRPETGPDFGLLHSCIHPEDRPDVFAAAEVMEVGMREEQSFRIVRPDGTTRAVLSRCETQFSPAGRALRITGVLIDVTDREVVARAQAAHRRRSRTLFETLGVFTSTTACYPFRDFSDEFVRLVGLPKAELVEEPTRPVVKEERQRWKELGRHLYLTGQIVHTLPNLILASGEVVRYRMIMVPRRDSEGRIESWSNYAAPLHITMSMPADLSALFDHRIESRHIRAGRALLDWSMAELAIASGLSLSTVRRLEESIDGPRRGSARAALAALRRSGIVFSLLPDSTITLGRR